MKTDPALLALHVRDVVDQTPKGSLAAFAECSGIHVDTLRSIIRDGARRETTHERTADRILTVTSEVLARYIATRTRKNAATKRPRRGANAPLHQFRAHLETLIAYGWTVERIASATGAPVRHVNPAEHATLVTADTIDAVLKLSRFDGDPRKMVPAFHITRRVDALVALGHSPESIAAQVNASHEVLLPHPLYSKRPLVLVNRVRAVFDQLKYSTGPHENVRQQAILDGCAPWLIWPEDSIDAPDTTPVLGHILDVNYREAIRDRYFVLPEAQ